MVSYNLRTITLLTDFGNHDAYAGIMKGVISGINPSANVIDICHNVPPQDVFQGAYLLYTAYKYFPKGTVHVGVVDPGVGSQRKIVCVKTSNYLFLVPENGILSFILREERPQSIFQVANNTYFLPSPSTTFHGRDIFAPVAAHLSLGVSPEKLGPLVNKLSELEIPEPIYKKGNTEIEGAIISVDVFGNLITNITEQAIKKLRISPGNMLTIIGRRKIHGLHTSYSEVEISEPLVLTGSAGYLEISVNQGNAQNYFHAKRGAKIRILQSY